MVKHIQTIRLNCRNVYFVGLALKGLIMQVTIIQIMVMMNLWRIIYPPVDKNEISDESSSSVILASNFENAIKVLNTSNKKVYNLKSVDVLAKQ